VNIQRYVRVAYGGLLGACIAYTFINKHVGGIAVELCVIVWAAGRIIAEALEALGELGKSE